MVSSPVTYEVIIGLEIHAQIATKTKMFCACSSQYFGREPNVNVCPICVGFPGQLPVLNQEGLRKGLRASMALGCEISRFSQFDRKNYFYPDLPKGFQISQLDFPVGKAGQIKIRTESGEKTIHITRLHLEEDAGKLTHIQGGTLVDFNRCGVGLMEIVSEPDLRSAADSVAYAKAIQNILRYSEASDADMEKGMMRFDASVSLRPVGETKLYPRSEIKNLNSFRSLETAIKFEIQRQEELWNKGEAPTFDTTVGYDDTTFKTYFLRKKEGADDYRYFPEPDLPPLEFEESFLEDLRKDLSEMPETRYTRYLEQYKLSESEALFLMEDKNLADYFDSVVKISEDPKKASTFVLSILLGLLKKDGRGLAEGNVKAQEIGELIQLINSGKLSMNLAKGEVFEEMFSTGKNPTQIVEEKGLGHLLSDEDLQMVITKVLENNEKSVQDYINGKQAAFQFLIGQCMKETKGKANPEKLKQILTQLLTK